MLALCLTCSQDKSIELSVPVLQGQFSVSIFVQGIVEAKNARSVNSPRLRRSRPELAWKADEGSYVKKGELVVKLKATDLEVMYRNALDKLEIAQADLAKNIAESVSRNKGLQSDLAVAESATKSAQLQLTKMPFESEKNQKILRLRIQKTELEAEWLRQKIVASHKIQKEEQAKLKLKIKQAQNSAKQAGQYLNQLQLFSPVDGYVQHAKLWNGETVKIGAQLWPNMPILKIPDLSTMQVKMQVPELVAQRLRKGQATRVEIPSIGLRDVKGRVSKVARMAKALRRGREKTGVKQVEVIVELDTVFTGLVPGLSANCQVTTKIIENALILPLECVFERDSVKVVYSKHGQGYSVYPISIQLQDADFAAIIGQIDLEQQYLLAEPAENLVAWPEKLVTPALPNPKADSTLNRVDEGKKRTILENHKESVVRQKNIRGRSQ